MRKDQPSEARFLGSFKSEKVNQTATAELGGRRQTVDPLDAKPLLVDAPSKELFANKSSQEVDTFTANFDEDNESEIESEIDLKSNENETLLELPSESPDAIQYIPTTPVWQRERAEIVKLRILKELVFGNPKTIKRDRKPLKTKSITADGNCFFRSVSYFLTGSEAFHGKLREATTSFTRENETALHVDSQYLNESRMERSGTWATDREIFAAASVLKTKIFLYTKHGEGWKWAEFRPVDDSGTSRESLYIHHISQNHYEPVIKI